LTKLKIRQFWNLMKINVDNFEIWQNLKFLTIMKFDQIKSLINMKFDKIKNSTILKFDENKCRQFWNLTKFKI
jgi:hypothetical protein